MKTSVKKEILITIELTSEEGSWLMGFIQNARGHETKEEQQLRFDLFNALRERLNYGPTKR